jgi:hypothetical protein
LFNEKAFLPEKTLTKPKNFLKNKPAYIFHHFMKCGGTSLTLSLKNWFLIINDHYKAMKDIEEYKLKRYDISKLNSENCIVGHFNYEGIHVFERYPEVIDETNNIKVFTFIRDPLSFCISLYYYTRRFGRIEDTLLNYINSNRNLLAYYLPCHENNYKEILNRYFFIGITERMQESVNKLAEIFNKRKIQMPIANKTERDSQMSILTDDFVKNFKLKNELDYKIYNYCAEKFNMI